jgi:two-component sensor histidine kinase
MRERDKRVRRELEMAAKLLRELAEERPVEAEAVREAVRRVEALLDAAEGRGALELEL